MEYNLLISGLNKTEDDIYVFQFRITENGIVQKESLNSVADELSIFIPKKNSLRYETSTGADFYGVFGDFESNFVKRGDKVDLSFGYKLIDYDPNMYGLPVKFIPTYIVNEVIIGETEIEIKCIDYMYFLNSSSFFETTNKKLSVSVLSKELEKIINKKIKVYNDKILKIAGEEKGRIYTFITLGIVNQPDFDIDITLSSNKISVSEVLKILADKYFINTRIFDYERRFLDQDGENISLTKPYLMIGGDWLKIYQTDKKTDTKFSIVTVQKLINGQYSGMDQLYTSENPVLEASDIPKNEIFFSDIPQNILISKLGVEKARNYHKIIERDDFVMQNAKDVRLKIIAKVHNRENKTTTIVADNSDVDGNIVSYNFYEPSSSVDVTKYKKLLDTELSKLKYDGFKQGSSFTTFGFPIIRPGDIISLDGIGSIRANHLPEQDIKDSTIFARKGSYLVETVETTFDKDGWRQRVSISVKIPNLDNSSIIDTIYPDYTEILLKGNDEQYIIQEAYQKQQDALKQMDRVNNNKKLR
jgi:hypothetical protein